VIKARARTAAVIAAEYLGPLASIKTGVFSFRLPFDIYFSLKIVGVLNLKKIKLFKLIPNTYNP
jgi:hypothetical protein